MPATISIDSVLNRIRQGEPLRWVPYSTLGLPPSSQAASHALMLGGDELSVDTFSAIEDHPGLIEQPQDSDGITPIQLFE